MTDEAPEQTGDASEVLGRIAYLLERAHEPTYRVRAFRKAADVASSTGSARLAALARAGRLTELPGIGDTTAAVIADVLAGRVPGYLAKLEGSVAPSAEATAAEAALGSALVGDLHAHSEWSDGGSPVEAMAVAARELGHSYLAMTDHSPRLKVANGLSRDRLLRQLELIAECNERLAPFRILTGIEVDILDDGSLDQDDDLLAVLDVVVASVHSKLAMEAGAMTRRMVAAVTNPHVDILGHCTGRIVVGKGRRPSSFDAATVFAACAEAGTAVEINSRPERLDPPDGLLRLAVDAGCLVSIDTDAHAPGQLEWQHYGVRKAVDCGVDVATVINTWPAQRLVSWANERGTH